ncbi:hypothetical protein Anapl_16287 [Anas platyrhynchos]|uniref:Uncharacterized protein n=1 Tax=Anas platyrhynchos TaxID=8839 RepID=R0L1A6_ANAPL|nr:hypothetical protein Anapl_16287 [Anas platyrhynchos]
MDGSSSILCSYAPNRLDFLTETTHFMISATKIQPEQQAKGSSDGEGDLRENRLRVLTGSLREAGGAAVAVTTVLKVRKRSRRVRTYGTLSNERSLLDGLGKEKLYDSQVGGLQGGKDTFALPSCSSCQLFHANDRHVKLHENLEMRYGTEKERNQEKLFQLSMEKSDVWRMPVYPVYDDAFCAAASATSRGTFRSYLEDSKFMYRKE